MRIARLWTTNWLRFQGDNTVDLDATVYGITAQHDGDARRSNWAGKTSLIEAIRFALFGVHRAAREDGWISHGETGGQVSVTLSDGTLITRSRRRGQATKLVVNRASEQATGDAAQAMIDRVVGLTRDDFEVTCWFGQKQLARLILARPVERFDLVSNWFGLDPLQRGEERTRLHLSDITARVKAAEEAFQGATDRLAALRERCAPTGPDEEALGPVALTVFLAGQVAARAEALAVARAEALAARADLDAYLGQQRAAYAVADLAALREEGRSLGKQIAGMGGVVAAHETAKGTHEAAKASLVLAAENLRAKRSLSRGEFTGSCPVDHSACPVAADINARTGANGRLYDDALTVYDRASKAEAVARVNREIAAAEVRARDAAVARLDALREQAHRLLPLAEAVKGQTFDPEAHGRRVERLDAAHAAQASAETAHRIAQESLEAAEWELLRIDTAKRDLARVRAQEGVARAALRIFGRQGAQKRIAEGALAEIEHGANGILREAGIDLSLRMQWGREGVGLASWCSECGAPFPASARVRSCERCKAERGPKIVERLDVELSDRSGAAEDLAGAALQLAAAAWLRREREVSWSVAFIDEPFGSLDEANRKAFATQLLTMLRGRAGFEQAFIVAHHPDVIDGLPGRLLVQAGAVASTVEVAS